MLNRKSRVCKGENAHISNNNESNKKRMNKRKYR